MKFLYCILILTSLLIAQTYDEKNDVKVIKDKDPLFLIAKVPYESKDPFKSANSGGKFFTHIDRHEYMDFDKSQLAYVFFYDYGELTNDQLIILPKSKSWKFLKWRHIDTERISALVEREVVINKETKIETWEIIGNGSNYEIIKK